MNENQIPISLKFNLKTAIYNKRMYFFAFIIPVVILSIAYAHFGVYPLNPAGEESVLVLDLNGQYVYYFENLRDVFWGKGSPFTSWSRNLSGEIIGIFAYYLASPFTLIVMLLPRAMMTTSLLIMQLCKVGTASIVMRYYLSSVRKYSNNTSMIFAVTYALMGYMIVQLMDPMWLDGLIYLPLICKGIEKIIEEGKLLHFIIPLTLMFVANFYIGWMIVFFCILYFIVYLFCFSVSDWSDSKQVGKLFISGSKFAVGGVLSAVCSAWLLVPLYFSLSLGKFEFTDPNFTMKTQFDFIDFFVNLLPNVYDTCRPEGSPVVYCGVLTVVLIPLFFMNNNIRLSHKIGYGMLALSIVLSMYMSTVDIAWHGFQVPNWLPYRYSFMCSFVFILMAANAFERIEGISYKEIGGVFFLLFGYVLYVDKQDLERTHIIATIWLTILLGAVYSAMLYLYKKHSNRPIPVLLLIILMVELGVSSTYTIYQIDKDVVYSKYSSYNRYITLGRNTVSKIKEMDTSPVYRIESNHHRTVNDAMAFDSYGISHSSSTLNSAPIEFLRKLGFSYGGHYIKYKGSTYVTDALLGIKYVMEKGVTPENEDIMTVVEANKHYDKLVLANGDSKDIFYVYENPNALPIAFMADSDITELTLDEKNPFIAQNQLFSALATDTKAEYFKRIEIDKILTENAKPSTYGTHSKYTVRVEGENSHIEFLVTAPTDDMVYVYYPSSYERKVNMWLNKEFVDYYFEGGNKVIQTLGRFAPGEQFSLITTIAHEKNEVLFEDELFYYLDEEAFLNTVEELKQNPLEIEYFEEDHIKGTVTADKDGVLFTTISWEPGWTITVDGEEVEAVKLADALIGVPVSEGTHTIEMKFFPKGMKAGIIISIAGLIAVIIIAIVERRRRVVLLDRLYE